VAVRGWFTVQLRDRRVPLLCGTLPALARGQRREKRKREKKEKRTFKVFLGTLEHIRAFAFLRRHRHEAAPRFDGLLDSP
jgi:hypothetical protein